MYHTEKAYSMQRRLCGTLLKALVKSKYHICLFSFIQVLYKVMNGDEQPAVTHRTSLTENHVVQYARYYVLLDDMRHLNKLCVPILYSIYL